MAIWKTIEDFPNYEVSDDGRVRSISGFRRFGSGRRNVIGAEVQPKDNGNGYLLVTFYCNGKNVNRYVHRLVATAFLPIVLERNHVNHINGDKTDNSAPNLEWCDQQENCLHRARVLRRKIGVEHGGAKLTEDQVKSIRLDPRSAPPIALELGVSKTTIHRVRSGANWGFVTS